ncbi:MAG: nitronate monooxygenase [Erythrobacter sp.]|nr:nitronate monooxygenase [Erythrobacter sp.]
MALNSRICDLLKTEYPIVLAGMGGASVPALAAAVSNAGGLGVLGAAACAPGRLREWIAQTRALTDKPFGVDTLLPASVRLGKPLQIGAARADPMALAAEYREFAEDFMAREGLARADGDAERRAIGGRDDEGGPPLFSKEFFEAQMEVVIEEKVAVYAAGLGNPGPWMDRLHANGTVVMAVIGKVKHAQQVVESGVDVIVAQGHDGGGHNSPIGTISLIPQVVDAVGDRVPVLGAGGISDGRGVAAAFMLGAEGAWVGNAFLATEEAGIEDFQKEAIVDGGDADTVVSRSITGKPARMIRNKWADAWVAAGKEPLPMPYQSMISGLVSEAERALALASRFR